MNKKGEFNMEEENNKTKREEFVIKVGPLLKKVLDTQKEIIKKTTWNCVSASDYESGEIIAKKVTEGKLV